MRSRTNIETEYTPCGLTDQGTWRPLTMCRYRSKESAERALAEYKELHAKKPKIYPGCGAYMVMKRTVVTTIGEWEGA